MSRWNDIDGPAPSWVSMLNKAMLITDLPSLRGPSIYIASDYAGEVKNDQYSVYSFLFCDLANSKSYFQDVSSLRRNSSLGYRRMNFKNLNDKIRLSHIENFLTAAGQIEGVLLNLVLNKSIIPILDESSYPDRWHDIFDLKGNWKDKVFTRMVRIVHFVSVLMGGLLKEGQNAYWISDDDNIFSNPDFNKDVGNIIGRLTSFYLKQRPGELGLGTTAIDEGDLIEEDLTGICDLVAGTLAELIPYYSTLPQWNKGDQKTFFYDQLREKTQIIGYWLSQPNAALMRKTFIFEPHEESFKMRILNLERPKLDYFKWS